MNFRLIISIFVLFFLISTGMIWYTNHLQENVVKDSGLHNAKLYADAITSFRTLYTSEVVSVAKQHGLEVTHDYLNKDAIPLPATLSILLGKRIGESGSGASARLYSPYPFPWRKEVGGLVGDFSKKAWENLSEYPDKPFFKFYLDDDKKVLRYAVADQMRPSCINCHNTHPDSPKLDWKTGDIRGVLEVIIPLNEVISNTKDNLALTIVIYLLLSILGIIGIFFMLKQQRVATDILETKNENLQNALDEINTLRGIIPICSYCHSIRDDEGAWSQMEAYISSHSDAKFSHGICPKCEAKVYADAGLDNKDI